MKNENKKKILDEQEKDFAKDKESSQPLLLTDELKAEGIEMISFSKKYLYVEDCNGHSVHINLFKDSISRTLQYFDSLVDGTFNDSLKKSIKLFIAEAWGDIGTKLSPKLRLNPRAVMTTETTETTKAVIVRKGKATKAQLIIPVVKPHLNKLFTDEYGIPHAGIQARRPY